MTAGGALQPRHQAPGRDVLDFAKEGERDVPDVVAGPPQVWPAERSGAAAASSSSRAAAGGSTATNSLMTSFLAGVPALIWLTQPDKRAWSGPGAPRGPAGGGVCVG